MSDKEKFLELKRTELDQAADYYLVDASDARNKGDVVDALEEFGVTWEMYANDFAIEQEAEASNEESEEVEEELELVYFQGRNSRYDIYGYTFTQKHPYVPVPRSVADQLVKRFSNKFRKATLDEAESYYDI